MKKMRINSFSLKSKNKLKLRKLKKMLQNKINFLKDYIKNHIIKNKLKKIENYRHLRMKIQ
jgi:hypothetical protein